MTGMQFGSPHWASSACKHGMLEPPIPEARLPKRANIPGGYADQSVIRKLQV